MPPDPRQELRGTLLVASRLASTGELGALDFEDESICHAPHEYEYVQAVGATRRGATRERGAMEAATHKRRGEVRWGHAEGLADQSQWQHSGGTGLPGFGSPVCGSMGGALRQSCGR